MKKFLSIILAAAIILSLIPAAFAADATAASETANLTLVYDISGVVDFRNSNIFSNYTEEYTHGFFKIDTANSTSSLITTSGYGGNYTSNGFAFRSSGNTNGEKFTLNVYVPVAGNYKMTGGYSNYIGGGVVEVSVNGTKVGEYDCTGTDSTNTYPIDANFNFENIPFNKGWNTIKFSTENSKAGGTIRTFNLILGEGSGYALMGVHEKSLTVGDTYAIETLNSSKKSYTGSSPTALNNKITEGLTYVSSNTSVAEVSTDGTVTAKGYGKATITVSDGTGVPYDIAVSVDDPSMPTIVYDISKVMKDNGVNSATKFLALTEEKTNGFFRANPDCEFRSYTSFESGRDTTSNNGIDMCGYVDVSFDVYVPVAGNYTMTGRYAKWQSGGKVELYVNDKSSPVGSYNCYDSGSTNTYSITDNFEIPGIALNKGWNKMKFYTGGNYGTIRTFSLVGGSGNALMPYFNGNTTLEVGETATLKGFLSSSAAAATVGYSVEGDCVTVSNDGTIEAKKAGKATVTMTETAGSATVATPYTVDITVVEQDPDLSDAFDDAVVGAAPSGYTAPTVNAIDATGIIDDPVLVSGGAYKITAPEEAGERGAFLYWKKAMSTNERILSFESEFNYVPESEGRNILVAVYEGDVTSDTPKCYNANGQYLPDAQPIPADLPSMAGYGKASAWAQYKDTDVYVAQYALEAPAKNIDITVEGGEGTGTYAYGDTVTCTATGDNFKCWKKDGKIVSIDDEYTFKAWEDSTVEAVYQADVYYTGSTFKILIDSFTAGDETGVMAEFIGFGNNVVEKGIMFEDNRIAMTTVGNQFSVIADAEGTYVGYAIVDEDGALKLIIDGSYTK